jgi:hypothetical protein
VRGERDHVRIRQRELASSLGAIGEQHAAAGADIRGDLVQRLQDPGLVVGVLDRDQRPLAADR